MPRTPGILLSPTPTRRGLKDALLFHRVSRDLGLVARTGQVPAFARAGAGGAVLDRNGRYTVPVHSQPRYEMVDLDGDGIRETAGLVLEPARTNLVLWSCDFANAAWAGAADFTLTDAVSLFPGQVAKRHTNLNALGFRSRTQTIGTLSAAGDTVYGIVENVDADTTSIVLFDSTAGVSVHLAEFTWATRVLATTSGSGSLFAVKLAEVGPNGGPVYLLGVSGIGTLGNNRRINIYPTGTTQNGKTAILHHAQMEGGVLFPTSPIITVGASATRIRDSLEYPFNARPGNLSMYMRMVSRGHEHRDANSRVLFSLGTATTVPRIQIQQTGAANTYIASIADSGGSAASGSVANASVEPGSLVELLLTLQVSGDRLGRVQLTGAINNGTPVTGVLSSTRAVGDLFSGSKLAIGAIPEATSVDWAATFLEEKVASGILTLDQIREAQS